MREICSEKYIIRKWYHCIDIVHCSYPNQGCYDTLTPSQSSGLTAMGWIHLCLKDPHAAYGCPHVHVQI